MRLAAAIGVIAIAFSAAIYIHQRHTWTKPGLVQAGTTSGYGSGGLATPTIYGSVSQHPSWEDPVAILIATGGVAIAAGILTARRKTFAKPSY